MNDPTVLSPHTHPEDKSNVKALQLQVRDTLLTRATTSLDQLRQLAGLEELPSFISFTHSPSFFTPMTLTLYMSSPVSYTHLTLPTNREV